MQTLSKKRRDGEFDSGRDHMKYGEILDRSGNSWYNIIGEIYLTARRRKVLRGTAVRHTGKEKR